MRCYNITKTTGFNEFIIKLDSILLNLKSAIKFFFRNIIISNDIKLIKLNYQGNDYRTLSRGKIIVRKSLDNYIVFNLAFFNFRSDVFKPFGSIGDIPFTLNQICNNLKDLKWEGIINSSRITINVVPVCANLIGYGVLMRGYVKHVYKQPLLPNLTEVERKNELLRRNRNLALFGLLGAPLTLCLLKV